MKINPTLLITSSQISEEVFSSYINDLNESYDDLGVKLISEKLGLLQLDENLLLKDKNGKNLLQYNSESKWLVSDYWQEFKKNEENFRNILRDNENATKSLQNNNDLKTNYDITVGNTLNILVVFPVYKLQESVFLTWLLHNFSKKNNQSNTNLYFIGLLPEVEESKTKNDPLAYQRTFACLSECDAIIEKQQDLVNLFSLISNKNENNEFVGNATSIFTCIKSCFSRIFESEIDLSTNNRQSSLISSFGKLGIFSALGFSSYAYKKRRLIALLKDKTELKIIEGFNKYSDQEIDYRSLLGEVDRFSISKTWDDKQKLFEDNEYIPFSKKHKLDNIGYISEKTTDVLFAEIEQAKNEHFDSAKGYFKNEYLPQINNQLSVRLEKDKAAVSENIRLKFQNGGITAFRESLAFSYLLCGKHPANFFKGEIESGEFNFSIAKFKAADYFKDFLPEETSKIYSKDFLEKENNLKNKIAELTRLRNEIALLEKRMYGFKEPIVNIKEQSKKNIFFNINGVDVSLSGLTDYSKELPQEVTPYKSETACDQFPRFVDLRNFMSPVENQMTLKSCSANAVVSSYEYFVNRATNEFKDFSRLFVYYNARSKSGSNDQDTGSAIYHCIESIMHDDSGLCIESTWPYNENSVNSKPANKAYEEAKKFQVLESCIVETDVETMKGCLADGYPFIFGLKLFNSFQNVGSKGIVPMPMADEVSHENHGLHAMLCVGYSDTERFFIVKNSWGTEWGDNGYCYIPYDYLSNKELNMNTSFLIKKISVMPDGFDLKRGIARESATLFTFGKDATKLELYKNQLDQLNTEVKEIQSNFLNLELEYENQNYQVLQNDFINQTRELRAEVINKKINEDYDRIRLIDAEIQNTKQIKEGLLEKRSRFQKIFFTILPSLLIVSMLAIYFFFPDLIKDIFENLFGDFYYLKTCILISVAYAIYALITYKLKILNPLNAVQSQLLELSEARQNALKSLIASYDQYFEICRQSELYKVYHEFIVKLDHFVNETLISGLLEWENKIEKHRQNVISKIDELDFNDSFNFKHACNMEDIDLVCSKMNTDTQFLEKGKKSLKPYFYGTDDSLMIDQGFKNFIADTYKYFELSEERRVLNKLNILDFLFATDEMTSLLDKKKKVSMEGILNFLNTTSSTLMSIYSPIGVPNSIQNLILSIPQIENQDYDKIVRNIKSQLNSSENFHQYNNMNDTESSLSFFRSKSMLPAYILSSVQESKRIFDKLSEEEKRKLFSDSSFENSKLFPDEMLN
jgi:C1A family cysteine protease